MSCFTGFAQFRPDILFAQYFTGKQRCTNFNYHLLPTAARKCHNNPGFIGFCWIHSGAKPETQSPRFRPSLTISLPCAGWANTLCPRPFRVSWVPWRQTSAWICPLPRNNLSRLVNQRLNPRTADGHNCQPATPTKPVCGRVISLLNFPERPFATSPRSIPIFIS